MAREQTDSIQQRLLRRRSELLRLQQGTMVSEQELVETREPDWMDLAAEHSEAANLERLSEAEVREVRLIEAALQRVRDGAYGTCRDCGNEIDPRRLEALPWADRCLECASENQAS